MATPFQNSVPQFESQLGAPANFSSIGLPWRLLLFALFLFGFSVFVYLGIGVGYGSYLDAQSSGVDAEIKNLAAQVSSVEQETLVAFYSQIVNVERVLGRHQFASNVFPLLETQTSPQVYFTRADFSVRDRTLALRGRTSSVERAAEQLALFDASTAVEETSLTSLNREGAAVVFEFAVRLKQAYLEKLQ